MQLVGGPHPHPLANLARVSHLAWEQLAWVPVTSSSFLSVSHDRHAQPHGSPKTVHLKILKCYAIVSSKVSTKYGVAEGFTGRQSQ